MIVLDLMRAMAAAGCSAQQMLAAHEHLVEQIALTAVAAALFADSSSVVGEVSPSPVLESGFTGLKPDSAAVAKPPLPAVKVAALAGLRRSALKPAARAVGERLVEHFNLGSERCDPAIETIAAAAGIDPRSVRRGLRDLERSGLITVAVHRGRNHTNAFGLDLRAMAELAAAGVKPDSSAKPDRKTGLESAKTESLTQTPVRGERRVARAKVHRFDPAQPELRLLAAVPGRAQIAEQAAEDRLRMQLATHLGRFGPRFAARARDEIAPDRWAGAVAAETSRAGSGFAVVLEALGPAPPIAAGG